MIQVTCKPWRLLRTGCATNTASQWRQGLATPVTAAYLFGGHAEFVACSIIPWIVVSQKAGFRHQRDRYHHHHHHLPVLVAANFAGSTTSGRDNYHITHWAPVLCASASMYRVRGWPHTPPCYQSSQLPILKQNRSLLHFESSPCDLTGPPVEHKLTLWQWVCVFTVQGYLYSNSACLSRLPIMVPL